MIWVVPAGVSAALRARGAHHDVRADGNRKGSLALQRGGHVKRNRRVGDDAAELLRDEEERLVAAVVNLRNVNGTADGVAKIVVAQRWARDAVQLIEVVVGVQVVVAEELISATVQLVGAGPRNHVYLAGSRATVLRGVGVAQRLKFGNRIDAGEREQRQIRAAVHVIGTVDRPVVGTGTLTANRKGNRIGAAQRVGGSEIDLVRGAGKSDARLQAKQLLVIACAQFKLAHLRTVDQTGDLRIFKVDLQRVGGHRQALLGTSTQRAVHREAVVHVQDEPGHGDSLKAGIRNRDGIRAERQRCRRIEPLVVRGDGPHILVAIRVAQHNRRTFYQRPGRIRDGSADGAADFLRRPAQTKADRKNDCCGTKKALDTMQGKAS